MHTKAVSSDFVANHPSHREDVPLLIDAESGELRCKVSGITLDGDLELDNSALEAGIGAPTDTAAAADDSATGLIGLFKRLLATKFSPLATHAKQDAGNASLASLDGKTPALASGRVPVDGSGVTQPVSGTLTANLGTLNGAATSSAQTAAQTTLTAIDNKLGAALPLPTGAASAAAQTTGNNSLSAIDATLTTISGKVGLAPSAGTASHGINATRFTDFDESPVEVKATAGNLLGLTVINPNVGEPAFLKLYNLAVGSVTVGTSTVAHTIPIPAATDDEPGMLIITPTAFPFLPRFGTAITAAVVTGYEDNDTAAPTADLLVQFYHA